jgi:hypothetical protein
VVSLDGNDLPLRDSSCYDFCSSIRLTFLVLCSTFGLGSSRRRPTRTSLVRSTEWSMPRSGGRRTLLPWSRPVHHRGSRPCAPETGPTGWRGDNWSSTSTSIHQGVRHPPGDETVWPLPGCASTRCATFAAYHAQVSYHLTVLSIFHYKYSVANNFVFHVLC